MLSCVKILRDLALVRDLESITPSIMNYPWVQYLFGIFSIDSKFRDYGKPAALISRDEKPASSSSEAEKPASLSSQEE